MLGIADLVERIQVKHYAPNVGSRSIYDACTLMVALCVILKRLVTIMFTGILLKISNVVAF